MLDTQFKNLLSTYYQGIKTKCYECGKEGSIGSELELIYSTFIDPGTFEQKIWPLCDGCRKRVVKKRNS
jgi:hypothetical protein